MKVKFRMVFVLSAVFMLFLGVCVFADEERPAFARRTISCDYTGTYEPYFGNKQTYTIFSQHDVSVIYLRCYEHPDSCSYDGLFFLSEQPFSMQEHYYAGVSRAIEQAVFSENFGCYEVFVAHENDVLTTPFPTYSFHHEQMLSGDASFLKALAKKLFDGTIDKDPNYKPAPVNPKDFNENEATKDVNLGYLKDVEFKTTSYQNSNSDSRIEVTGRRFTWNKSQSSTGYPLSDNVFVQIYADLYFDKKSFGGDEVKSSIGKGDFDKYGDYIASDGLFEIKFVEWQHDDDNPLYEQYQFIKENKGVSLNGNFCIDLKVRLIKKDSSGWKYGGWLTISDKNGDYHTEDEEGNDTDIPDDSHVDIDDDGNETETISDNVDLAWFLKQLTGLKDALGEFPALVSSVFGFLPPQLLTLIGVGIAAIIIIALVKAVL